MPHTSSQAFLRELDRKLWTAADKLRSNLDAAVYKHAVLGLIFLKYVSDSFAQRQAEIAVGVPPCESASQIGLAGRQIEAMLKDLGNDFFVDPDGYDKPAQYEQAIHRELEERDYYIGKNVFWVPAVARRKTLQDSAKLPAGTEILVKGAQASCLSLTGEKATGDDKATGKMPVLRYKITSTGKLIDDALEAVEKENVNGAERHRLSARGARRVSAGARIKLKNVLNKNYTQLQIAPANLAGLIDLIATIPFQHATPRSGGLRTASSSRLANRSSLLPDTVTRDQHPDLRADFVMALPSTAAPSLPRSQAADRPNGRINPPFNIKEWWDGKLEGDARWSRSEVESASHAKFYQNRGKYGTPPQTAMRECAPLKSEGTPQVVSEARDKNANFAWVQHMLHHFAPNGSMALLLANGSMSSNSGGEGDIRRALIEADLVETAPSGCALHKSKDAPEDACTRRSRWSPCPASLNPELSPLSATRCYRSCCWKN